MAMSAMSGILASGADQVAEYFLKKEGFEPTEKRGLTQAVCESVAHQAAMMADAMIDELGDLGPEPVSADEFLRSLCAGDILPHAEIGHRVHLWASGDYQSAMEGL